MQKIFFLIIGLFFYLTTIKSSQDGIKTLKTKLKNLTEMATQANLKLPECSSEFNVATMKNTLQEIIELSQTNLSIFQHSQHHITDKMLLQEIIKRIEKYTEENTTKSNDEQNNTLKKMLLESITTNRILQQKIDSVTVAILAKKAEKEKTNELSTIRRQDVAIIAKMMESLTKRETITAEEEDNLIKQALDLSVMVIDKLMKERQLIATGLAAKREEEKKAKLHKRRNSI